jgi:NAD(P)-dependent dehydrogenase (short-subunit alcohol dehydrogenase family)
MKVAIITGANAGVGFGLVQHLLQKDESMTIVMACRNLSRANQARGLLLEEFPQANINVEIVDVGNVASVFQFCENIKKKYEFTLTLCKDLLFSLLCVIASIKVPTDQLFVLQCWHSQCLGDQLEAHHFHATDRSCRVD